MKWFVVWLMLLGSIANGFSQTGKSRSQTLHLLFENRVGDSLLHSHVDYQNAAGETYQVRTFKYYISHICILYAAGDSFAVAARPHLVNAGDTASKHMAVTVPSGTVKGISFLLGIDSLTNTAGVQTGDLDPAKGMFWVWNTGYIMAKLEGTSPQSKAPGKQFSYDVGGYKRGENTARYIRLEMPAASLPDTFIITADVSRWFDGKNTIRISEEPMCHSPGKLAMKIADHYARMFRITPK